MLLIIIVRNGNIFVKLIIMVLYKCENIPTAKVFPFYHMVHYIHMVLYYSKSYKTIHSHARNCSLNMEDLANCTKRQMINTYIIAEFPLIQDSLQEYFNTKGLENFGHSPTTSSLSEHENICMGISLPHCKQA